MNKSAEEVLQQFFGYKSFRPFQKEIIEGVIGGQDTLVLMPTGGGKSLCYQIPALMQEGLALVVSPLISLMKDQVEALRSLGVQAAYLNSSLDGVEQSEIEGRCLQGTIRILYVSPEKLLSGGFIRFMQEVKVSLLAIDEAHCVSNWGHDFRPEYSQLKSLRNYLPGVPMVALTATADKVTREDIVKQLGMKRPKVFLASFDRPNIHLRVSPATNRLREITRFIQDRKSQSGIIYCSSRKNTEMLAEKLRKAGIGAAAYHAGMASDKRSLVQEQFIKDDVMVVCATVAFGMGIDKPNVRYVIHYNIPKNMESYYQEIGRAGRDGLPSQALLFYTYQDVILWKTILADTQDASLRELRMAKLDRMLQFANASLCRRKVLLNYFQEVKEEDCGNCDVCLSPRETFDGSILAQKALSAMIRLRESVGLNTLIQVLRGSASQEIISKNYHQIKTYGSGREESALAWKEYLQQMLNQGVVEIAYDEHYHLKQGPWARAVLFEGRKVPLVKLDLAKSEEKPLREKVKSQAEWRAEELFERLRALRKKLAGERGVPPYIIFNDKTLDEMAREQPISEAALLEISGVAQAKLAQFGKEFLTEIRAYLVDQVQEGNSIKGGTLLLSLELYRSGKDISEIAEIRSMKESTVLGHLMQLYLEGEELEIERWVNMEEVEQVMGLLEQASAPPQGMKWIFEHFEEKIPYTSIRLALGLHEKNRV